MKVKSLERKIANVEGFEVTVRYADGSDVRSDKQGLPSYPFSNAANRAWTVAQWKEERFQKSYPGFQVTVWDADGTEPHGRTVLSNVRDTYSDG